MDEIWNSIKIEFVLLKNDLANLWDWCCGGARNNDVYVNYEPLTNQIYEEQHNADTNSNSIPILKL